jgi:CHASE2 domain-containing sensor protein
LSTPNEPGHGDSPAAWTAVIIMLIGIAAGAVFFFLHQPVAVFICAGVTLLGLIIGWVMSKMGYGVKGPKFVPKPRE